MTGSARRDGHPCDRHCRDHHRLHAALRKGSLCTVAPVALTKGRASGGFAPHSPPRAAPMIGRIPAVRWMSCDRPGEPVSGIAVRVDDVIASFEDEISQPVVAQKLPDDLHRIALRGPCRQGQRRHVPRQPETQVSAPFTSACPDGLPLEFPNWPKSASFPSFCVTAQVQAILRVCCKPALRVVRISRPCLRAVSITVRKMQKFSAPSSVRKQPDTF